MNKRQLVIVWCALLMGVSMIWFPGSWFGYIVHGYPVIRPDSVEFLVKILMPLFAFTVLLVYSMRDKQTNGAGGARAQAYRPRRASLFSALLILSGGIMAGFIGSYWMLAGGDHPPDKTVVEDGKTAEADNQFRDFCRREGYRQEVEALTHWLKKEQAHRIAILYNEDDAYSQDLYTHLLQRLPDEKITVAFSETFKEGDKSFFREMKVLESVQPEAIIFMGTYEERIAFLDTIAQQSEAEFWQKRRNKIRWIE